ncbi:hypothetical protein JOM56_013180 [Amanita muscaria]
MLGGQINDTKIAMIPIVASLLMQTRNFIINTVQLEDNKLSPWIMISFTSRHLLVGQQAVICTQLKQEAILFRGIPSEPANKCFAIMRQVPTKHYNAIVLKLQTLCPTRAEVLRHYVKKKGTEGGRAAYTGFALGSLALDNVKDALSLLHSFASSSVLELDDSLFT